MWFGLKIEHQDRRCSSTLFEDSNDWKWFGLKIEHQDISPSNSYLGKMF